MIGMWSRGPVGVVVWTLTTSGPAPATPPDATPEPAATGAAEVAAGATSATGPTEVEAGPPAPAPVVPVVPVDPEPPRGRQALAFGSGMLFLLGAPLVAGGAVAIHNHPPEHDGQDHGEPPTNRGSRIFGYVLTSFGVLPAAVGIAFIALGARRMWRWSEWQRRQRRGASLGPTLTTTRHGTWTVGLQLRF